VDDFFSNIFKRQIQFIGSDFTLIFETHFLSCARLQIILPFFNSLMNFLNKIQIRFSCKKVGADDFGNEYFLHKTGKRFVVYRGMAEASKIPSEWHGWMHYTTDIMPVNINTHRLSWQKIHLPNLTGTKNAFSPKNSSVKNTKADYEAWEPKN
jgi:NADH:ubiquinone oxidoreductase subunit